MLHSSICDFSLYVRKKLPRQLPLRYTTGWRGHLTEHPFLICVHSFPSVFIIIFNSSVFSLCLTSSLESTPCFSPTASCRSLHLGLWSSYACQFSSFHKFITLIIHNSFTYSLSAQNLLLSQILPTTGPLSFSQTDMTDSGCSPFLSISSFVLVPCSRLSWFLQTFDSTLISYYNLLTNIQTNVHIQSNKQIHKEMLLKASPSLCYAMPVEN